jgi:hypothetical protein
LVPARPTATLFALLTTLAPSLPSLQSAFPLSPP